MTFGSGWWKEVETKDTLVVVEANPTAWQGENELIDALLVSDWKLVGGVWSTQLLVAGSGANA